MSDPVRVLVVDDSALMRKLIPQILQADGSIQVVGTAIDGAFALKKIEELKPQVVTLDLEMPGMSGMQALREITLRYHLPAIVVSSHTTQGASATFKALAMGAFDFVAKPHDASAHMQEVAQELISKIKVAAHAEAPRGPAPLPLSFQKAEKPRIRQRRPPTRIVAIGISTGGPNALQYLLAHLPGDFPASILVVQHMPEGFTDMFARRLDECCALEVKEAQSGDLLQAGRVLICPGNRHMRVRRMPLGDVAVLSDEERVNGHRPSVDVLFRSVADEFGPAVVAVLMTGMGDDGADAMGAIKAAGGLTIAQAQESCTVFGMPRAAIERGHALRVVALDMLANTLQAQCLHEVQPAGRLARAQAGH
jgi:two-component system chemotaxis response regulator CheB